jgi:Uncharacterized conserved protein (DUF2203)
MLHSRHYTVEQASAARSWVSERLDRTRRAIAVLREPAVAQGMEGMDASVGGAFPGRRGAAASLELTLAISELQAVDVVVRDPERGLVDFPAIRDGEEVYLCWLEGEEEDVRFWHVPDAGFAGRQPL